MYPFKQTFKNVSNENSAGKDMPQHQWPLNPAAYQNVCNDEVDWAALAQQWIYMKETCPYDGMPEAPPPPNISNTISRPQEYEEKGEAPMEVEKDDEQVNENAVFGEASGAINSLGSMLSENQNSPNWGTSGWNSHGWRKKSGWNTWTNPNMTPSSSQTMINQIRPQPLLPDPNMFNDIDLRTGDGYWSTNQRFPASKNSHTQSSLSQGDQSPKSNSADSQSEQPSFSIDAAKRKTLPAWIRQGLEKMEREKQKTAEKEREMKERLAKQKQANEEQGLNANPGDMTYNAKSKFDSESDSEEDVKEQKNSIISTNTVLSSSVNIKIQQKSKQEQLQDLMLLVRKTLTEILLEVTNEEIKSIASDTLSKKRSKARKAQPVRKTALSSLTGGLGLGIYADSDNSGNSSSDDSNDEIQSDNIDSDIELKESVKQRKLSFELKEKEIEAALAIEEEKEKRWLDEGRDDAESLLLKSEGKPSNDNTGEVQHESYMRAHGARREKKASRFSDPTDTVNNLRLAHGSIIYDAKQNNMTNKIDSTKIPFTRAASQYDEQKDSDSSSNGSKQRKRRKSNNSSSGDSGPESRYNKNSRKQYIQSKDRNRRRSRSSSSERSHRVSHNYRNRGSPNRKLYNHDDRETSSSKELYNKSSSSQRDDRTRSYSNSSSKEGYSRKRSRSRSSSKSSKYSYSRY